MRARFLISAAVATLLGLAACTQATAPAAPPAAAANPTPPPPATPPPPSADQRLAGALDHLGAKRGARGEILTVADDAFAHGHTKLQSSETDQLKQLATTLKDYPKADVIVEGYTDNRGNEKHDDKVSLAHADVVKQALVSDGLDATRIRTRGLGPTDPIGDNTTKAGRAQNDRVELVFSDTSGQFADTKDQGKTG